MEMRVHLCHSKGLFEVLRLFATIYKMDKYLIKIPVSPKTKSSHGNPEPKFKQATIESLAGVVVIEDILRAKNILELQGQSINEILSVLKDLETKNPCKETLLSTEIGKVVHRLCRHPDESVQKLARCIYEKWKTNVVNKLTKPLVTVKSDLKTEELRGTARKWLLKSLDKTQEKLAELIEREVFMLHKRLCNAAYKRCVRRIVFALKDEELRKSLTNETLSAKDLAQKYMSSL